MSESAEIPQHIGIIMDGNRRWAKARGVPALKGHARGQEVLRKVARHGFEKGIRYITVYAFSTENWRRSEDEVGYLMSQLQRALKKYVGEFVDSGVKIIFLGAREGLSPKALAAIESAESQTAHGTKGTLGVCFNYGGQLEIADAVKKIIASGIIADDITPELINAYLYGPELPPIDLVIRTSGEQRLSNFMLWRAAYSELYFIDKYWPDFTGADLDEAIEVYVQRGRRFGG